MHIGDWKPYAICPGCSSRHEPSFGKVFFLDIEVCPDCGIDKEEFEVSIQRYVNESVWWKPSTWGKHHYQRLIHVDKLKINVP